MRVTEKGQVTIPKPIRDCLGIGPGSEVEFVAKAEKVFLVKTEGNETELQARRRQEVDEWLNRFAGTGDTDLTTEEVMEITRGPFDDVESR